MAKPASTPSPKKKKLASAAKPAPVAKPANNVIELDQVHLTLGEGASKVHVLNGISLGVEAGESVGVVGPSGSGKSTLLMVMAGLERIDSGLVKLAGEDFSSLDEDGLAAFRGRNIGIIFQSFHLIPNMTALENVAVPLELAGDPNAFDKAQKELEAVGLGHRLNHYPSQMSGGEQQRVAIARALAPDPKILVADEPTGNLDEETGEQIAQLLFQQQRERGTTLVLVTHDPSLASQCSRTLKVRAGEIDTENRKLAS
ncbi:ABC transporter ATP-binding protein [Pseudahrensia aquimaris]|uniref:ABC transporter ATP-binding protein n=1 Tax=Pseudahrensia aquimaris TaxID=744461 RepID=A0ABW3FGF0_9HYPH